MPAQRHDARGDRRAGCGDSRGDRAPMHRADARHHRATSSSGSRPTTPRPARSCARTAICTCRSRTSSARSARSRSGSPTRSCARTRCYIESRRRAGAAIMQLDDLRAKQRDAEAKLDQPRARQRRRQHPGDRRSSTAFRATDVERDRSPDGTSSTRSRGVVRAAHPTVEARRSPAASRTARRRARRARRTA